jgi:N-formylglutamate amidohydrolase
MEKFPNNVEVFATHGTADAPDELKKIIRPEFDKRLQLNFSDWATWDLVQDIPESQRVRPKYGRIAVDPARAVGSKDLFREEDFNGIRIFSQPIPEELKNQLLRESWMPYHREIFERLLKNHGDERNRVLAIDIHDTGNVLMNENPEEDELRHAKSGFHMPPVIISTLDGKTASEKTTEALADSLREHLKLAKGDVRINEHYKGGYVTKRYGEPDNDIAEQLKKAHNPERDVFQVEFGRYLFVDEKSQTLIKSAMEYYHERLRKALQEVGDGMRHM